MSAPPPRFLGAGTRQTSAVFDQDTGVLRRFHAEESHELSERYGRLYVERLEAAGPLRRRDYFREEVAAVEVLQ